MLNVFDFDPETGEYTPISSEIIEEGKETAVKKSSTTTKKPKKGESTEPLIIREDNKLVFNTAAINLFGLEADDRVSLQFDKNGKVITPIVGKDEDMGRKDGNRFTKSGTVACRGKANEMLAKYGTTFYLYEHPNRKNIYYLRDEKVESTIIEDDNNIEIPEEVEIDELPLDITILGDDTNNEISEFTFDLLND